MDTEDAINAGDPSEAEDVSSSEVTSEPEALSDAETLVNQSTTDTPIHLWCATQHYDMVLNIMENLDKGILLKIGPLEAEPWHKSHLDRNHGPGDKCSGCVEANLACIRVSLHRCSQCVKE